MDNMRHFYGLLNVDTNDTYAIALFDELIKEIGKLQDRIAVLERERSWQERTAEQRGTRR